MKRLRQLARTPEIAVPVGVLLVSIGLLSAALAALRPDTTVAAALLSAVAGAYATVISVIVSRYFERSRAIALRKQELERETRAKKVPEYDKFVDFLLTMFFAEKLSKRPLDQKQVTQGMVQWTKPLLIWGSDEVVRKWGRLRVGMSEGQGIENLLKLEEFLFELRRDVSYPDTTLKPGDLLRLWVNDIDQLLEQQRT